MADKPDKAGKFKADDRVRVLKQKPNSNWAEGKTGRVHEIVPFTDFDKTHAPGTCYLVQLDEAPTKIVANTAGQEREVPRTYPFSDEALESE